MFSKICKIQVGDLIREQITVFNGAYILYCVDENKKTNKNAFAQRAVWRQSGCLLADTLVVIWKLTARTPSRETLPASGGTARGTKP